MIYYFRESSRGAKNFAKSGGFWLGCGRQPALRELSSVRQRLLDFVAALRAGGVPVSIAESLDAMRAVALVGVERETLRDALAACVLKEEGDRALFDAAFEIHFPLVSGAVAGGGSPRRGVGGGDGGVPGRACTGGLAAPTESRTPRARDSVPSAAPSSAARAARVGRTDHPPPARAVRRGAPEARAAGAPHPRDGAANGARDAQLDARALGRQHRLAALRRGPFADLTFADDAELRAVMAALVRELRGRLARRFHRARRGRIDVRRTLRLAVSTGGAPLRLAFRGRRPGRPDLIALCDVSGSVAQVSERLLGLVAPAAEFFRSVAMYVFVHRLYAAAFDAGRLVHDPGLDRHAFSDFGLVLDEFCAGPGTRVSRNTVVLILGDARNNRRPSRASLLAELRTRARAVVWLNPEPRERWNTGDSVIGQYARGCDAVLECLNLDDLVDALGRAGGRFAGSRRRAPASPPRSRDRMR